jgi:ABC-type transporter Mla subunit MlaD
MEFIIEQQAQFSADIEVMREVHAADTKLLKEESKLAKEQIHSLNEAVHSLNEAVHSLNAGVHSLNAGVHSLNAAVTAVVGLVGQLSDAQVRTNATMSELARAQARTDERLNILIDVVGRHFNGNGGSGSSDRL